MSELRTRSRRIKEEGENRRRKRRHEGDDSDDSADFEPKTRGKKHSPKKRRVRYGWACSMCKIKHRSCDGQRPCHRCKNEGFADTCNDGPAYQEEDVYKGKEPNRQFTCRNEPTGLCATPSHNHNHGHTTDHCAQRPKAERRQEQVASPVSSPAFASCAYQAQRYLPEHEICAKLNRSVLSSPYTTPSSPCSSPRSSSCSSPEPFLFQFLEPPAWHHGPSTPPHVPNCSTYLPPQFAFGPPFSSFHLDDEDEQDFFLGGEPYQMQDDPQICYAPSSTSDASNTATDPFGSFLMGDYAGGLATPY